MIERATILVTSLGRTGTEFFARLFSEIIPDGISLHEPDIIQNVGVQNKLKNYLQQIRCAGAWRMVVLKSLGKWTLVKLSDSRFVGSIDDKNAISALYSHRKSFIQKMPGSIYIESNIGFYGLLDIIPFVFENSRTIFLVRDGRDWIRSHLNWGEAYNKKLFRKLVSHNWPTAIDIDDKEFAQEWNTFSRFEKLCWAWMRLNEYALETLVKNEHVRFFQFEKIFLGKQGYDYLNDLVSYVTSQPGIDPNSIGLTSGWLEKKGHMSSNQFPSWEDWSKDQKDQFVRICGPLMEKLGYKF